MRLVTVSALSTVLLLAASPVYAQSDDIASSDSGKLMVLLASLALAISVFLLIIILFGKGRSSSTAAVQGRLGSADSGTSSSGGFFSRFTFLRKAARSAESAADKRGATNMIASALEQANIPMKPGEAIIAAILIAILLFVLVTAVTQSFIWGIIAAGVVLILALLFVNNVAARQRKKFETQLPDTLNLLATSLRAGYSLLQAVEAVGEEAPDPTRREFGRAMAEIRLGRPMDEALSDISDRMSSVDFEWTVLAIEIQREVGGNLAEVLQTTSETMVQRNRLRREMKALTAEGRISAIILALLPVGLFLFISLANPGYMEPLLTSPIGLAVLAGGVIFIGIGIFWMQKIVKVDA
jgi:tight adherence protein B